MEHTHLCTQVKYNSTKNYMKITISKDPRYFQIVTLSLILLYGLISTKVSLSYILIPATIISCQLVQYVFSKSLTLKYDYRSALITSLSLLLLLRTNEIWLMILVSLIAISSKFMVGYTAQNGRHKHLFNPANIAIVIAVIFFDGAWVSTGQWGNAALFSFALACFATLVLVRAKTLDISLAFLFFYAAILFARALWLGDPLTIPIHQLQNGALLLFTFFMISDPKTSPDSRLTRIIYALIVAIVASILQFAFFIPLAILYSLAICCFAVPLLDRAFAKQ